MNKQRLLSIISITISVILILIVVSFWVWSERRTNDLEAQITTAEAHLAAAQQQATALQGRVDLLLAALEDCGIGTDTELAVSR